MRINYSSYAHVIEKGMNRRNMTKMAKVLFEFMCDHEEIVSARITKKDLEEGITHKRYIVPDKESIEWFRGEHDVAETLQKGAGATAIIADAPDYFEDHVLEELINPQKLELVINALVELVKSDDILDATLRENWLELRDNGEFSRFLAEVFLYAVPQPNNTVVNDQEITAPELDDEDTIEIQMFESLVKKHAKPASPNPPLIIDTQKEMKYVKQLLMAYADAENIPCMEIEDLQAYPKYRSHFDRQRKDFYSADTIREQAKEVLKLNEKDGFDILKEEIFSGVVDIWEADMIAKKNGFQILSDVLISAKDTPLSNNTRRRLLDWVAAAEKKGICHILVGEDRIWWVNETETI